MLKSEIINQINDLQHFWVSHRSVQNRKEKKSAHTKKISFFVLFAEPSQDVFLPPHIP